MRAIIIEETRFKEILDYMSLKAKEMGETSGEAERLGVPADVWATAVHNAHRMMHYEFVTWAQSHGASCTK